MMSSSHHAHATRRHPERPVRSSLEARLVPELERIRAAIEDLQEQ